MARRGRRTDKQGRSEGEGRFVQLPYWLLETPAWLSLSANSKVTLVIIAKRYNGSNNGRIAFGVRSGVFLPTNGKDLAEVSFGLSRDQIGRAIRELMKAGFVVCTQEASFDQKRLVREWRLTWLSSGTASQHAPTKDFARLLKGQNLEASRTGAPNPPPTVALVHPTRAENDKNGPYSRMGATMGESDSRAGATHLVYQGAGEIAAALPRITATPSQPDFAPSRPATGGSEAA